MIGNGKADDVGLNVFDPPAGLVQQRAHFDAGRTVSHHQFLGFFQGAPGVENVVNDQDRAAAHVCLGVGFDRDRAVGRVAVAIRAQRHEFNFHGDAMAVQEPDQVRHKDKTAFQQCDDDQVFGRHAGPDFIDNAFEARAQIIRADQGNERVFGCCRHSKKSKVSCVKKPPRPRGAALLRSLGDEVSIAQAGRPCKRSYGISNIEQGMMKEEGRRTEAGNMRQASRNPALSVNICLFSRGCATMVARRSAELNGSIKLPPRKMPNVDGGCASML